MPTPTADQEHEEVIWGIPPFKSGCPYAYMPDLEISNIHYTLPQESKVEEH